MNFEKYIDRQRVFSYKTFGPGSRTQRVLDHIRKEMAEIEADPLDLEEWIDIIILAVDGAWRTGAPSDVIAKTLWDKLTTNIEKRQWPDWRTAEPGKAIEHIRTGNGSG